MKYICLFFNFIILITIGYSHGDSLSVNIPSGLSMKNIPLLESLNIDIKEIDTNHKTRVQIINNEQLLKMIQANPYSIIHVCGSWCPTVISGLDDIKKIADSTDTRYLIIISIDIFTKEQVSIMNTILLHKGINIGWYIVRNDFGNNDYSGLEKFRKMDHIYNLIHSFDSDYHKVQIQMGDNEVISVPIIPYTAIIDRNAKILYKKIPDAPSNLLDMPQMEDFYRLDVPKMIKCIRGIIKKD